MWFGTQVRTSISVSFVGLKRWSHRRGYRENNIVSFKRRPYAPNA